MSRFTSHLRTVFLALLFLCGVPGAFAKKEKKVTPPPPPPPPMPQKIKVLRDSPIEITLRIYGRKSQSITYVIRRQPKGKLTPPKNVELEAASVQYQAPANTAITADSFEYAAKSDLGVSAPALVEIEIVDIPAEIIAPVELSFGPALTGTTDTQTFEIENRGGSLAEGDIFVDPPWRIEVSPHYRLEPNQRRSVAVTFAPEKPGNTTAELRFSSQPDRVTTLRGKALPALEARPAQLRLDPVAGALIRAGALEIVNHTTEPQTVNVSGSNRVTTDAPVSLSPGQSATLMVRTSKDDVRPLSGELILTSGNHRTVVPVQAEALHGVLQTDISRLELRAAVPGGEPSGEFVIRNLGGESGSADLIPDAEFKLSSNKASLPAAGETRIEVRLATGVTPPMEGSIEVRSGGYSQRIIVSAAAVGGPMPSAQAVKSSGKRPARKTAESEPEAAPLGSKWSPYETDPTTPIDPVNVVRTLALGPTACTLQWHVERSSSTKFIAETRELKIEKGQLTRIWHKHRAFDVERAGNYFRGTIEQLEPSRMYNIRVRGLNNQNQPAATVFEASITTRPPEPKTTRGTWKFLTFGGAVAVIAFLWLRRLRANGAPSFSPTKTQRIH